jgi:hypothetical protein
LRLKRVRLVNIWQLLFADDAAFLDLDEEGLQITVNIFYEVAKLFGLTVSLKKTKTMRQPKRGSDGKEGDLRIEAGGVVLEEVSSFVYLGGVLASEADTTREINRRRGLACAAFKKYVRLFKRDGIRSVTKVLLLKVFVVSVLLYGAQTWTVTAKQIRSLEKLHLSFLLVIVGKRRRDHIAYADLLERFGMVSIEALIRRARLMWLGHMLRMGDERIPKMLLHGVMKVGARPQGGTFKTFSQCARDDLDKFGICEKKRGVEAGETVWWQRAMFAADWKSEVEAGVELFDREWRKNRDCQHQKRVLARSLD